ncbi:MAG: helix-turn-helix transcriptional regulator [Oligoflexales bacterium]
MLSPKEIQICNMIKNGLTVKEIAQMFHLSPRTVDKHRENIRKKLGLKSKKINLATYLLHELNSD